MNKLPIVLLILLISCGQEKPKENVYDTTVRAVRAVRAVSGVNGGLTTDSKSNSLTNMGPDSLFLSQHPLVEYLYDISIDYEEIFTYEIDAITNDTISTTSVINEISRDTISITSGPIWLPFDAKNEVALKVGLKKEFLNPDLEINIKVNVVDDLGILFTQLLHNDITWSSDDITFGNDIYTIADNIPIYDLNGKILNETDGMIIPRFGVREFYTGIAEVTRDFEITITILDGSVVVAPFSIKFVDSTTYYNRQCWLSGDPNCKDLF